MEIFCLEEFQLHLMVDLSVGQASSNFLCIAYMFSEQMAIHLQTYLLNYLLIRFHA
jgi:hypothetical protein